ncbi:hypothetical protein CKAN_02621600 [Cinnamomum micranthum f. kanehirae]|uniref:Response regulatory domain-containing protein n=1 Tax=Cinnamomum micranthum f. kanehirae TaxID=337451 RepID=A0A443Q1A4_9MAGN|nr:hypothetical protein CKAN_02621600 [Cinnamomum micranthum f. kanehirae]
MRENGKKRHVRYLRYDLLVVSLLSSLDCELVVSGLLWVVLVFVGGFWGWMALQRGWRMMVRIWKDGLDWEKREEFLMAPVSPWKITGIQLSETRKDLMVPNSINSGFWSESRLCWFLRLPSVALCKDSFEVGMNSEKQNFLFAAGNERPVVGKILLVEDIEINRVLLRKLFRDMNLLHEEAENGQVAVDYFKQGKNYDLVLMDKEMPVMDGHEATRQLRSLGVKTPIVALTGNSLQSDKDMFFQAGADEFQTKPLTRDDLGRLLARYGLDNTAPCRESCSEDPSPLNG